MWTGNCLGSLKTSPDGVSEVGEVDLRGELEDQVIWGECSGLLRCNCLLRFLGVMVRAWFLTLRGHEMCQNSCWAIFCAFLLVGWAGMIGF